MNYVRTKYGIYEIIKRNTYDFCVKYRNNEAVIMKRNIVEQADTIEELCDEFVCEIDDNGFYNGHICFPPCKFDEFVKNAEIVDISGLYKITNKYGAIWTEWGLKYVAKINEERRLELL